MYREWLGVTNPAPSYYGLLGLPERETDEAAVLGAGRRVKRKVRAYQIGLYRKQALDLLAEIGQAVSVLTNAEKKRAYDGELMSRWKETVEELYQTHCDGEARDPGVLEAWLTACRMRGVPVTRLMPYVMRTLTKRAVDWPPSGDHGLGLPINLWIYRDAVILGQCLHIGVLDKRIEAVKQAQKQLAIPEGLARLVAEEVGRAQHLFARTRLVTQGKADPEGVLLRLGRRIRRFGGRLGNGNGNVLASVAGLLGVHTEDLDRAMGRMDERPVELSAGQAAAVAARHARERLRGVSSLSGQAAVWVKDRPQLLIGFAVVAGVAALLVAVLVVAGVVRLWQPETPGPVPPPSPPPSPPAVAQTTVPSSPGTQTLPPASRAVVEDGLPDWLKEFQEKYPVGQPKPPTPPVPPVQTGGDKPPSEVKFFGVKGDKRDDGSPVEVLKKPPVTPKPTPKKPLVTPRPTPKKPPVTPKPTPKKPPVTPKPTPKKPPVTPRPAPKKPPAPKPSPEDEQNAERLLTIAETLETMPGAWEEDTIKAYENVVKSYPGTAAAKVAAKTLKRLRGAKPPAAAPSSTPKKTP